MIFILLEIIQIYLQIGNGIHYFTEDVNKVMAIFIIKIFRTIAFINNKDEDNSSKTLNDKNQQASSQKFKQLSNGKFYIFLQCPLLFPSSAYYYYYYLLIRVFQISVSW